MPENRLHGTRIFLQFFLRENLLKEMEMAATSWALEASIDTRKSLKGDIWSNMFCERSCNAFELQMIIGPWLQISM